MIDVSKYTAHTYPGKFEGESAATEYFYEQMLHGGGETLFPASDADETEMEEFSMDGSSAELFQIDAEESDAFGLPIGHWFMIREDSIGFVYGTVHASREDAEREFNDWVG